MPFPPAAVKQKAKNGLVREEGALFYPSVKRSPCVLLFVCGWIAPAALWEKIGFCFFWPSKERNIITCTACVLSNEPPPLIPPPAGDIGRLEKFDSP